MKIRVQISQLKKVKNRSPKEMEVETLCNTKIVKLFYPSLSKMVEFVASEDHRIDLGSIAYTFGLVPATVKLNGHFISRGADLLAASVTWRSLLSFFSARGISTGSSDSDALIVDGKLCKSGSKRLNDRTSSFSEEPSFSKKQKLLNENPDVGHQLDASVEFSLKRKQLWEHVDVIKRLKIDGSNEGIQTL